MALKDLEIRALKPRDRVYKQADERGLYIEVHPGGSKLWRMKFRFLGRDKRIAFGSYPEVGLAEARRRRDEARQQIRDGIDPTAERRREKLLAMYNAANTFGEVAEEYIKKMIAEGRAEATTTKASWLLEQLEPIARNAIADLKPVEILAALKRIEAKGKHETARRCRSFASRVFRYGVATGRGETDPTSVLRGALVTPKVQHHGAVLDPEAVGEMLRAVDAYSGHQITRLALQISPHVMARPGELRQALWPEFDLEKAVWKIPPERMKMRRPHAIPLSWQVLAYLVELNALTGPDGFVFPAFHTSRRPLSENTINQAFRRMGYAVGEITAHGLRTTASTLLNESGKWSPDDIYLVSRRADDRPTASVVQMSGLDPIKLIWWGRRNTFRQLLQRYCRDNDVQIEATIELDSITGSFDLVRQSDWSMLLPITMMTKIDLNEFRIQKIVSPNLSLSFYLVTQTAQVLDEEMESFVEGLTKEATVICDGWNELFENG